MITIDLMFIFKLICLIMLSVFLGGLIISSIKNPSSNNKYALPIGIIFFVLPLIYIFIH